VAGWWAESSQEDSRVASNMKQRESAQRAQTQLEKGHGEDDTAWGWRFENVLFGTYLELDTGRAWSQA